MPHKFLKTLIVIIAAAFMINGGILPATAQHLNQQHQGHEGHQGHQGHKPKPTTTPKK